MLMSFLNLVLLVGFVGTLVAIYQSITGTSFIGSRAIYMGGGFSRVYHPNIVLIVFCTVYCASLYVTMGLHRKLFWKYLLIPIYLFGIVVTFHRSIIGLTVFSIVLVLIFHSVIRRRQKSAGRIVILALVALVLISVVFWSNVSSTNLGSLLLMRAETAVSELQYNEGSFAGRMLLIGRTLLPVMNTSPFIGFGFNYNNDLSARFDPFALTIDAEYGNMFLMFGLVGFILFGWLYFRTTKYAILVYRSSDSSEMRALALAIIPMPFFFVIIGFFSSILTYLPTLTTFVLILALLNLLVRFAEEDRKISLGKISQ